MRAKTKKEIVLVIIVMIVVIVFLIIWNPGVHNNFAKIVSIAVGGVVYYIVDKLWKWEKADKDKSPSIFSYEWKHRKEREMIKEFKEIMSSDADSFKGKSDDAEEAGRVQ